MFAAENSAIFEPAPRKSLMSASAIAHALTTRNRQVLELFEIRTYTAPAQIAFLLDVC